MAAESKLSIVAAIAANLAIAVTKFTAAAITGSSAMVSEAIHSVIDTGNDGLILLGLHMSQRPPDEMHPFGHGKDLYFWTLIVAVMIFAVGGGMSVYEGIMHLAHPHPIRDPTWNYVVLGIAAIFEGSSLTIAFRQFRKVQRDDESLFEAIAASKDPSLFTVLFEDSAALLGLLAAFLGVFLGYTFGNPYFDGGASIVIGLILAVVAVALAYQSRGLLVGEGAEPRMLESIRRLAEADPGVIRVRNPLTMYFGPHTVLLTMDVQFRHGLSATEVESTVDRLERSIRDKHPDIKQIFLEAESISGREPAGSSA